MARAFFFEMAHMGQSRPRFTMRPAISIVALALSCAAIGDFIVGPSIDAAMASANEAANAAEADARAMALNTASRSARALAEAAGDASRSEWPALTDGFEKAYGEKATLSIMDGDASGGAGAEARIGGAEVVGAASGLVRASIEIPSVDSVPGIGESGIVPLAVLVGAIGSLTGLASLAFLRGRSWAMPAALSACSLAAAAVLAHGTADAEKTAQASLARSSLVSHAIHGRLERSRRSWESFTAALPAWSLPAPRPVFALVNAASEFGEMGAIAIVGANGAIEIATGDERGWVRARPLPAAAASAMTTGAFARSSALCGFIAVPCEATARPMAYGKAMVFYWPPELRQWSPSKTQPRVDAFEAALACLGFGLLASAASIAKANRPPVGNFEITHR